MTPDNPVPTSGSQLPRDLTSILAAIQNGVQAVNNLTQTLKTIFPSS